MSWVAEQEILLGKEFRQRKTYFKLEADRLLREANELAAAEGYKDMYRFENMTEMEILNVGDAMEKADYMLKQINDEVKESKKIFQAMVNEIRAMQDIVQPELLTTIKEIRSSRMAVTTELQKALKDLREVRKFFLESEYQVEMDRLKQFVSLGEQLKKLIDDGTMDAICDVILKLAVEKEV